MRRPHARRPSPSLVISVIALVVAMGGTGYAAFRLPRNSVGSAQVKKNAITSVKVKNGSLKRLDFAAGGLPVGGQGPKGDAGPRGQDGPPGAPGAAGTAKGWGVVNGTSVMRGKNIGAVTNPTLGSYCVTVSGAVSGKDIALVGNDWSTDSTEAIPPSEVSHVEWASGGGGCAEGTFGVKTNKMIVDFSATDTAGDAYGQFSLVPSAEPFTIVVP